MRTIPKVSIPQNINSFRGNTSTSVVLLYCYVRPIHYLDDDKLLYVFSFYPTTCMSLSIKLIRNSAIGPSVRIHESLAENISTFL